MGERRNRNPGEARAARAKKRRIYRSYRQNKMGVLCVSCIVLVLVVAMSTQIYRLHAKDEALAEEERQLTLELENEQDRQQEIEEYGDYVTTPEYIEQIAKSRLGLVHSNEIIFKEQKEEP